MLDSRKRPACIALGSLLFLSAAMALACHSRSDSSSHPRSVPAGTPPRAEATPSAQAPSLRRGALADHREAILADQRFAASLGLLTHRRGHRDAGPVIGPRVHWLGADRGAPLTDGTPSKPFDMSYHERLRTRWLTGEASLFPADLGWMARLAGFDYWDLDHDHPAPSRRYNTPFPEPDPSDLIGWAKLRIAKGILDEKPGQALTEVEELARLGLSSEHLGTMINSLHVLSTLHDARDHLIARGVTLPAPRIDRDALPRLHRALLGAMAMARLETPAEFDRDFQSLSFGRCAALADGLDAALAARPWLRETHAQGYARLDRLLASAKECRLVSLRQRWAAPNAPSTDLKALSSADRRARGERLLAQRNANWLEPYDRQASAIK